MSSPLWQSLYGKWNDNQKFAWWLWNQSQREPDGLSGICQPALGAGWPSLHSRGSVADQRAFLLLLAGEAVFPARPVSAGNWVWMASLVKIEHKALSCLSRWELWTARLYMQLPACSPRISPLLPVFSFWFCVFITLFTAEGLSCSLNKRPKSTIRPLFIIVINIAEMGPTVNGHLIKLRES